MTSAPVFFDPSVPAMPPSTGEGRVLRITDRTLTIDDMLRFAAGSSYSGLLRVDGSTTGELEIDEGQVIGARLSGGVELGDVLTRRVGEDRSDTAVADAVLEHAVEVLLQLELATSGTTTLELVSAPPAPAPVPARHRARLDVADVLEAKHARLREWKQIASHMPPADASLRLAANLPPGEMSLDSDDWRVLLALRDPATVAHVVREAGIGALCACRSLLRLLERGAVQIVAEAEGVVGADRGTW